MNQWKPGARLTFASSAGFTDGNKTIANTALTAAATAPTTNAGKLPPPNRASQGPLSADTNIWAYIKLIMSNYEFTDSQQVQMYLLLNKKE